MNVLCGLSRIFFTDPFFISTSILFGKFATDNFLLQFFIFSLLRVPATAWSLLADDCQAAEFS